ncbi:Uncharacterised protein [Mycobacterium tuberculosis]|nr:Uncharacterised protein [Mycobacterium tuberculosis]
MLRLTWLTVYGAGFIDDSSTVACWSISIPPKVFVTGGPWGAFSMAFINQ